MIKSIISDTFDHVFFYALLIKITSFTNRRLFSLISVMWHGSCLLHNTRTVGVSSLEVSLTR